MLCPAERRRFDVRGRRPPAAAIVTTAEPHALRAAVAIQKYIEKMSGARLPIIKEGEATRLPVLIFVGHTAAARRFGVKIPAGFNPAIRPEVFEEEGFVIKTKGAKVFIGGNSDGPYRGTIYGAYQFLERLGCRWYFPGEWGEVVPEKKTVVFPETDLVSRPDFALREQNLGGWFPSTPAEQAAYADWNDKIKYTHDAIFYPPVGDGFLGYLLPPKEFMAGDPKLYAMDQSGSRKQPENFNNGVMLSLVNPKTFDLSVQNLRAALAGSTTASSTKRDRADHQPQPQRLRHQPAGRRLLRLRPRGRRQEPELQLPGVHRAPDDQRGVLRFRGPAGQGVSGQVGGDDGLCGTGDAAPRGEDPAEHGGDVCADRQLRAACGRQPGLLAADRDHPHHAPVVQAHAARLPL